MNLIGKREMNYGSYGRKWLNCSVGDETIRALVFTVNRHCSGYAGQIPLEAVGEAIASASGKSGPGHEYRFRTMETLPEHGRAAVAGGDLSPLVWARSGQFRT